MKRILTLMLSLVMILTLLTACGGSGGNTPAQPAAGDASSEDALFSAARTLNVALTSEPTTMDAAETIDTWSSTIFANIYETLLVIDENGDYAPKLAESYSVVDDTTYDFTIRKGVKFHNGDELTVDDVVFSLERAMASAKLSSVTEDIASVEAVDESTVRVHLSQVSAPFLSYMTHPSLVIYSQRAVNEAGDEYYKNPVGTGPYLLEKWDMGVEIVLKYFEDYYGAEPDFTTVSLRFIPEATSRAIELEAGSVDLITDVAATDLSRIENGDGLGLATAAGTAIRFMGMNCEAKPLDDVRVRQAIAYAIDVEAINKALNLGYGTVATSPVSSSIMYCSEVGRNEYDLDKAKALLTEAGYPDGFDITLSTDTRKEYGDVCVIIQQQLAKAGINVTLNTTEWAVFLDDAQAGNTELYMLGWSCATPDPDTVFYTCFHSSERGPSSYNMSYLNDEEVDRLLDDSRAELDPVKREAIYEQLQTRLAELKGWVYLYDTTVYTGINTNKIADITIAGTSIQPYYDVKMVK